MPGPWGVTAACEPQESKNPRERLRLPLIGLTGNPEFRWSEVGCPPPPFRSHGQYSPYRSSLIPGRCTRGTNRIIEQFRRVLTRSGSVPAAPFNAHSTSRQAPQWIRDR